MGTAISEADTQVVAETADDSEILKTGDSEYAVSKADASILYARRNG